jgi:hypothetical protein
MRAYGLLASLFPRTLNAVQVARIADIDGVVSIFTLGDFLDQNLT